MSEIEDILRKISNIFQVLGQRSITNAAKTKKNRANELKIYKTMYDAAWLELHYTIRNVIVPKFWLYFKVTGKAASTKDEKETQLFNNFGMAVNELHSSYQLLYDSFEHLHLSRNISPKISTFASCRKKLRDMFRESLLGQMPTYFNNAVNAFYGISFNINHNSTQQVKTNDNYFMGYKPNYCVGCKLNTAKCFCLKLMDLINEVNVKLLCMDLLDCIAGQAVTLLVQKQITDHIKNNCYGIIDRSHLKNLELWLDEVVLSWLTRTFNENRLELDVNNKTYHLIQCFKVKLTYFLYENFAHSVIDQFFNIIIDFPESIPILDDLKICMEKIDMRKYFIKTIKASLEARILHPGVNTIDIITGYVAAIKAIRYLDNSGVILETVTAPIKEYLRKRNDTVRRVVTGLTEEGPSDLSEELTKSEVLKNKSGSTNNRHNWESWMPDPVGVDQTARLQSAHINRSADIISMIVDIYGSKELFMNEYRNLMADRLLTQLNFNADKEIRNLELLKIRFGENLLHSCEVMLRDVADSKRINSHIQTDKTYNENKSFEIASLIISAQFWPCFNKENLELPEEIANEFRKFTTSYEAYKGNRTLNWRTITGRVTISIELSGKTLEMTVSPTQAVIIYHFQNDTTWTLEELSYVTKVPPTVLRRRIRFWQTHGIIEEVNGVYQVIDDSAQSTSSKNVDMVPYVIEDEDVESAMASASDQREEELQVFWSYIVGMLTNLDSLPIERIHQMLKLFASNGVGIEFTQDDLRNFLQRKVREHKLLYSGGVYQLAK